MPPIDTRCPAPTPIEQGRARGGRWLLALVLAPMLISVALLWSEADSAVTTATHTSYALRPCSTCREVVYPDEASCRAAALAEARRVGETRTSGGAVYTCMIRANVIATFRPNPTTPTCPPAPAPQTRPGTCPTGTAGSWTQTGTSSVGPAPTCTVTVTWGPVMPPEGACTPIPPPDAGQATLTWTPPTRNTDGTALTNLAGYRIVHGLSPGELTQTVQVGASVSRHTLSGLPAGTRHFAVKAFNSTGVESALSNVQSKVIR